MLLAKILIILVVGVVLVLTDRGSYRRRTQPLYDALFRLNGDVIANHSDATYGQHLSEANAAYQKWRDKLRPDELLMDSEQALTVALLDYRQLSRLRASNSDGSTAVADDDSVERTRIAADAASHLKRAGELLNAGK